jgi:hypothetical protein
VIHEENFVDPNNPEIHTQTIENLFFRVKQLSNVFLVLLFRFKYATVSTKRS